MKLPVWLLVMVKSAVRAMGVIAVAVLLAALRSPPPPTVAWFVTEGGALLATLTVRRDRRVTASRQPGGRCECRSWCCPKCRRSTLDR